MASSLEELAGKVCAFLEKGRCVVNNCKKIQRLILVFCLFLSNKHPYCVPPAWDRRVLKCLLAHWGII